MQIKPIKTEQDYQQALARLEKIFDARPGSREGDELEILGILIDKYESDHFPIELPVQSKPSSSGWSSSTIPRTTWPR